MNALIVWSVVGLRLDLYSRLTSPAGLLVRPFTDAIVEVPATTLDALSSKLCSSLVLVRTIRRTLFASDARPWLNSSTPLLANLTTFELCTVCKGTIVEVSGRCISCSLSSD
jgi:type IV secretory pathway protease TraF